VAAFAWGGSSPRQKQGELRSMHKAILRLRRRGQGLVEYGLILVLIAVVIVLIFGFVSTKLYNTFSRIGSTVPAPP